MNLNPFDLQIQSTASDGKYAPADLVRMARDLGVTTVALTDHDTVSGVPEALRTGEELGIEVLPGIEFSCEHNGQGFHLLGYGLDISNPSLLAAIEKMRLTRIERAKEIVERLKRLGFVLEYENVERRATGGVVGRPQIVYEVLENPANQERLGSIRTMHDFIVTYVSPGKPAFVAAHDFTSEAAIRLIHGAGGIAVWSHPGAHYPESPEELGRAVGELVGSGLDGLEVFSPANREPVVRRLYDLADRHRLLRTGGSDFHREPTPDERQEGGATIGDFTTYGLPTDDLLPTLRSAIARRQ